MKKYRFSFLFKPISFLADIATMNIAFIVGFFMTFKEVNAIFEPPYLFLFWFFNVSWIGLIILLKPFADSRITFNFSILVINYSKNVLIHIALITVFLVSLNGFYFSRQQLLYTYLLSFFFGFLWRFLGLISLRFYRANGKNTRSFAILGSGEISEVIKSYFEEKPELGFQFEEHFSFQQESIEMLYKKIKSGNIDVLYASLTNKKDKVFIKLIELSEVYPFKLKIISDFIGFLDKGLNIEYHGVLPIINVSENPYTNHKVELIKRFFDLFISAVVLIAGAPLFIVVMIITKISSKGPIFFKQERMGRWGKTFQVIKFRSMSVNSDEIARIKLNGKPHSIGKEDPRITKWGRFMRKTRIDEIPQFWNVLLGEMSIVGPRPLALYDVKTLMKLSPYNYRKLLSIRPGLTSIGQITFGYATTDDEMVERMGADMQYLNKYSIESDLAIILKTIRVMFLGLGK